jgi:hypothetical protein
MPSHSIFVPALDPHCPFEINASEELAKNSALSFLIPNISIGVLA